MKLYCLKNISGVDTWMELDISADIDIDLMVELNNYLLGSFNSTISKTIILEATLRNNNFFDFVSTGIAYTTSLNKKFSAKLICDNGQIFWGDIVLNKVVKNLESVIQYEITFVGDFNWLFKELKKYTLQDLDLGQYKNDSLIFWNVGAGDNVMGGLINVGNNIYSNLNSQAPDWDSNAVVDQSVEHLSVYTYRTPVFVKLEYIISKIFEKIGCIYSGFFDNDADYKKIYLNCNNIKELYNTPTGLVANTSVLDIQTITPDYYYLTGAGNFGASSMHFINLQANNIQLPYYDPNNFFTINDSSIHLTGVGLLKGKLVITQELEYDKVLLTSSGKIQNMLKIDFVYNRQGVGSVMKTIFWKNDLNFVYNTDTHKWVNNTIVDFDLMVFNIDGVTSIYVDTSITAQNTDPNMPTYMKINAELTHSELFLSDENNRQIDVSKCFTPIPLDSFLLDIMKIFNLCYYQTAEREFYFDDFENFIKNDVISLEKILDISQNIELTGAYNYLNRKMIYKFADSDDYWNDLYKKLTNEEYGQYEKLLNNELCNDEKALDITNFAPAPIVRGPGDTFYAELVKKDDAGNDEPPENIKLSMFYCTETYTLPFNIKYIDNIDPQSFVEKNYIHIFTHLRSNYAVFPPNITYPDQSIFQLPYRDLNFGENKISFYASAGAFYTTDNNLYKNYFEFLNIMLNSPIEQVMTAYVYFDNIIPLQQLFEKKYYYKGSYYILLKIENYKTSGNDLCKATFLKYSAVNKADWGNHLVTDTSQISSRVKPVKPVDPDVDILNITIEDRYEKEIDHNKKIKKIYYFNTNEINIGITYMNQTHLITQGWGWVEIENGDRNFNNENKLIIEGNGDLFLVLYY